MIIWGFDGNYKELGEGPIAKCENCGNVVVFQVIQQSRRFKLYFVPVLKYNSQYWALCPTCTAGYQLPSKNDALALVAEANVSNQELIGKFMEMDNEEFNDVEVAEVVEQPELVDDTEPDIPDKEIEDLESELQELKKRKVDALKKKEEKERAEVAEVKKLNKELEELKKEVAELENP